MVSEKQAGVRSHVTLDVHVLAELQRLQVPHSDDSLKYQYRLEKDRYGTLSPAQVTHLRILLV